MTNTLDPAQGIIIYTDGSCNSKDRKGGWAWVAIDTQGTVETGAGPVEDTTINRMELQAPTEALKWLADKHGPCSIIVYCDSQYVVLGFNNPKRARRKNVEYWDGLEEAADLHGYLEMHHVPSVTGGGKNFYNGLADKLAGEARKNGAKT